MKIKPLFVQLDRSVEKRSASHGNRKSIVFTDQYQMLCGTLRSRTEKLGWARSSREGGGTSAYCKVYTGSGVGVFLLVQDGYIGQDPTEVVTLGEAMFVNGEPEKKHGWYAGEPQDVEADNVIAFGEVSDVIYSETITDLQKIMA